MNANWNDGYVTEVPYTHGYYRELSPSLQRFALLTKGYVPPADGAYLELGYGQGLSACIHAAASGCQVWGTDFNPVQAAYAQRLAHAAGLDVRLFDHSFEQLLEHPELPEFQYVGAHGIWSWISDDARKQIVELMRRQLGVGGVAYFSYNTFPGWSAAYSMRHLLALQADVMGSQGQGVVERLTASVSYAQGLADSGAVYFQANPQVTARLAKLGTHDKHYLAHEYFNRNWQPMHFSDFNAWLEPAKVEFVASAHLLDHIDVLNLMPPAQEKLNAISHPMFKESVRDYLVNQQFRRDLYMRGQLRLSPLDQREALMATSVALLVAPEDVSMTITGVHEVTLQESIYRPLLDSFAKRQYKPCTLLELAREFPQVTWDQLMQAVMIMIGAGHMHPVQSAATIKRVSAKTAALNKELCQRARSSGEVTFLASPVIGAGVVVNRFEQLFLASRANGKGNPAAWVADAWGTLQEQGQKLIHEGRIVETAEENIRTIEGYAEKFVRRLPILVALGIA